MQVTFEGSVFEPLFFDYLMPAKKQKMITVRTELERDNFKYKFTLEGSRRELVKILKAIVEEFGYNKDIETKLNLLKALKRKGKS